MKCATLSWPQLFSAPGYKKFKNLAFVFIKITPLFENKTLPGGYLLCLRLAVDKISISLELFDPVEF